MNREQRDKVQAALDFLCRRLEENGLYSPALQPVVREAMEALRSQPQGEPVGGVMTAELAAEAFWGQHESNAAPPADGVVVPAGVIRFLNGEGPLKGVYFGDKHPSYPGKFWWRFFLPAAPKGDK